MKKLLITLVLFCLSLGIYSQHVTYNNIQEGIVNPTYLIEDLRQRDFDIIGYENNDTCSQMTLVHAYDETTDQANVWVSITACRGEVLDHGYNYNEIHIQFTGHGNYNHLINKIERRCREEGSPYNKFNPDYIPHYTSLNGTQFTFYKRHKEGNTFHINVFKFVECTNLF